MDRLGWGVRDGDGGCCCICEFVKGGYIVLSFGEQG